MGRHTSLWVFGQRRLRVDFVEKVASLKSLKNCQNTNDIFD